MNNKIFYKIASIIDWILFKILFFPKIEGKKNIPKNGSFVLVSNHTRWLDPVMLVAVIRRDLHFLAKKELFDGSLRWFMKGMGCIPVDRKIKDKNSMFFAIETLKKGNAVAVFPEGTINRSDDLTLPFKMGAVAMAYKTNSLIVPCVITGKYKLFGGIKVKILKPISVGDNLLKENDKLRDIINTELDKEKRKIKKDRNIGYSIVKPILGFIYKLYYNPKIIGKENIPKKGSIVIVGNHKHIMDQNNIIISTKRIVHYMAKKEYFDGPFEWFFRMTGCIPVNRSIKDNRASKSALKVLNNGWALGLFPEGTRNKTKEFLLPFKYGAVSMAKKTDSLIVPFGITGDYKFRSKNLTIRIGKPYRVTGDLISENKKLEKVIGDLMRENLKK